VIDSGLSRVPRFDPRSSLTRLETIRVTKDAADQRAGRAGRLGPGICFRLWTSGIHLSLADQRKPEILEADLAPLMLELAQWGVREVNELTWITLPPAGAVNQALDLLNHLEALDQNGITARGKEMLKLPTHPRIAHLLLEAKESNEMDQEKTMALAADVAALLEERDPLQKEVGADLTLRIEALRKWRGGDKVWADRNTLQRIEKLSANWRKLFKVQEDNSIPHDTHIGRLVMAAYPQRVAQQQGKSSERYKLANGRLVKLPTHDALIREPFICVAQLDAGNNEGKVFLAAPLALQDIMKYASTQETVRWDDEREMVVGMIEKRFGNLVLESKVLTTITADQR